MSSRKRTVIAALWLVTSCSSGKGSFSVLNNANEPVAHALVAICGQTIELTDIGPGHQREGFFDVTGDSHYIVEIEFSSGKKIRKETGYVTNGMDFYHEIEITDSDIEIVLNRATPRAFWAREWR